MIYLFFFFFQAEDGIRDSSVTGVQTCALPISKFHTYSFGNIMLIARQKPDATNVAGLRTWNSLGRFVKRGEKGIFILAPMIGKKLKEEEATAEQDTRSNGEARLYGFRAVYVFDTQTDGKDLPTLTDVNGDVSGYRER